MPYADTDAVASEVTKIMMSASNAANTHAHAHAHTHARLTALFQDYPGGPVPER